MPGRKANLRIAALAEVALVVALAAIALSLRRFTRFEVIGRSMAPTLEPGDWLLAERRRRPIAGDIVLARDPRDPARTLVKRVAAVDADGVWLAGDNPAESTDSRTFGPVPRSNIIARVRWRYWPDPRRL